jgi:hypothetical protein
MIVFFMLYMTRTDFDCKIIIMENHDQGKELSGIPDFILELKCSEI